MFVVWEGIGMDKDDGQGAVAFIVQFLQVALYDLDICKKKESRNNDNSLNA